jgi:hypothetical protein
LVAEAIWRKYVCVDYISKGYSDWAQSLQDLRFTVSKKYIWFRQGDGSFLTSKEGKALTRLVQTEEVLNFWTQPHSCEMFVLIGMLDDGKSRNQDILSVIFKKHINLNCKPSYQKVSLHRLWKTKTEKQIFYCYWIEVFRFVKRPSAYNTLSIFEVSCKKILNDHKTKGLNIYNLNEITEDYRRKPTQHLLSKKNIRIPKLLYGNTPTGRKNIRRPSKRSENNPRKQKILEWHRPYFLCWWWYLCTRISCCLRGWFPDVSINLTASVFRAKGLKTAAPRLKL